MAYKNIQNSFSFVDINAFRKPLKGLRIVKGYKPLWEIMTYVRDIHFESYEPVKCGQMKYIETI